MCNNYFGNGVISMIGKKIFNFFMQLIFLPISLVINFLVIMPIYGIHMLVNDGLDLFAFLFISAICLPLGIFFAKLFSKIKGRKTDDYWSETNLVQDVTTTKYYYGDEYIGETTSRSNPYYKTEYKSELTGWGWVAILTSFIAFPLRLIAFLVSIIALFVKSIYSTCWSLPRNRYYNTGNVILHTLFDFVIIPSPVDKTFRNVKGLIFIPIYIVLFVVLSFLNLLVASELQVTIEAFDIISILTSFLFVLINLILVIKFSSSTYNNYSLKNGILNGVKLTVLSLIPTYLRLIFLLITIFIK